MPGSAPSNFANCSDTPDPAAYAMAVRNSESKQRLTHLREKLLAAPG